MVSLLSRGLRVGWDLGWRPALPVSRLLFVDLDRGRRAGTRRFATRSVWKSKAQHRRV